MPTVHLEKRDLNNQVILGPILSTLHAANVDLFYHRFEDIVGTTTSKLVCQTCHNNVDNENLPCALWKFLFRGNLSNAILKNICRSRFTFMSNFIS